MRVLESGIARTAWTGYTSDETFYIVRAGGEVFYCRGNGETRMDGLPFALPGTLIYASSAPSLYGVFLDASLLGGADSIGDAELHRIESGGAAYVAMPPMLVKASQEQHAEARVSFERMTVRLGPPDAEPVLLQFQPMAISASQVDYASALVSLEPMTVFAAQGTSVEGTEVSFPPMAVYAAGGEEVPASVDVSMLPMVVNASQDEHNEVVIAFPAPLVAAEGETLELPAFRVTLPAFGGASYYADIEDIGLGSDAISDASYILVEERIAAVDAATPSVSDEVLVSETGFGADLLTHGLQFLVEEAGTGADDAATRDPWLLLEDGSDGIDGAALAVRSTMVLEEPAQGVDAALLYLSEVAEGVGAGDDEAYAAEPTMALEDVGLGDDAVDVSAQTTTADAEDIGTCSGEVQVHSISQIQVSDGSAGADELLMIDRGLIAWVMNTETGGVSWYDGWSFTGMAVVDGKVFAVGPEGLAVVGGSLDSQESIPARVQYGFNDFSGYSDSGAPKNSGTGKKRVVGLWYGYAADGLLNATVETYGQGYGPFTYAMQPRTAAQPRNNRVVPGKGLNSRYWRIGIANVGGAGFRVSSIEAELAESKRRL
ncbi:hypothetical protein C8245_22895 [Paracidovorax avenae]|nr:hypothetical protein C8245_22895 [Paracidovorax avenae]